MAFFSSNPSKRWTEIFFLAYSPFWIIWTLIILVPFQLFEACANYGYMLIGLSCALPLVILPFFLDNTDKDKPLKDRFWVKANLWIAVYSFIGNYFYTHYFYKVLGAKYTFVSWRLNDVPFTLYLMTHAYFCFYHSLSNVIIRSVGSLFGRSPAVIRVAFQALAIFLLSYATAYGETFTIAHFPHYSFEDKDRMYTVGSLFYAIYFFVSFPMFYRLEEPPRIAPAGAEESEKKMKRFSLWEIVVDSMGAGMIILILLDFWRLFVGNIFASKNPASNAPESLPWM